MLSPEILSRLSELNQQRFAVKATAEGLSPAASPAMSLSCGSVGAEDVAQLPCGEEVTNTWGKHWMRRCSLQAIWSQGDRWLNHSLARLDQCRSHSTTRSRELRALVTNLPDHVVYLDLETCGFAGSMIFLVGLVHRRDNHFQLSQLMARNYAEEKAMLQTLWSIAAENKILVTFNGKSFDWPMVHDRSTLHHLGYDRRALPDTHVADSVQPHDTNREALCCHDSRPELVHCDLLHHSRRRWKGKLPDCKLQTLERYVCRRYRADDIPGREIPAAYHDFVRSGDAWLMRSVLHHNALDLVTSLQLSLMLLAAREPTP